MEKVLRGRAPLLITAGKSLLGLQVMSEMFKDRTLKKYYLCFVKGKITKQTYIRGFLTKDEKTNKVSIHKQETGKDCMPIETEYIPIAWNEEMTFLKVHLVTGRTHQIRAHLASQGHPLLGDDLYGGSRQLIGRQALHCYSLKFLHPVTEKRLSFEIPLPDDILNVIQNAEE